MIFQSLFNKKPTTLFNEFATKSFSEAIKQGVTALGAIIFHSVAWGAILGIGVKGVVDSLFAKASQLENKIDKLLQQPFLSGVRFLQEALLHDENDEQETGRQHLLNEAHTCFVNAYNLSLDSLEDKTFIFTLDCLALAANKTHKSLVKRILPDCERKITEFEESSKAYEIASAEAIEQGKRTELYLYGRSKWTDKPLGFAEQKAAWKGFLKEVKVIEEKIQQQKLKIEILHNLYRLINLLVID